MIRLLNLVSVTILFLTACGGAATTDVSPTTQAPAPTAAPPTAVGAAC